MTIADRDTAYDSRGKSPAEIEHDIAATRAELGAVLDTLERRLAPRQLLEHGMDRLRDTMKGKGGGIVGETLRGHPVPLALIGAGIGWLVVGDKAGKETAGYAYARTKPRVSAAADTATETAGRSARGGIARAIEDHPLALGILGLMAGAALALMLPAGKIEERWIGPVRARVRQRADELRREAADRAEDAAERAADAVSDALKSN